MKLFYESRDSAIRSLDIWRLFRQQDSVRNFQFLFILYDECMIAVRKRYRNFVYHNEDEDEMATFSLS